ncbi:hypothetical protein JOF53_001848 [Crossiella equi]|uniref:STAS domain-containing protein n=1 Tax=Crossiella equi TaxID=130796 RepID=A0ABS5A8R7_9PSEU|nr:hypothetical protein [Crossiella equi]MBP2472976.1 hypothetical protein [Crossiella equi]
MPKSALRLLVSPRTDLAVVQPVGVLDLSTHRELVDGLLKVAAEEPRCLVVHVGRLAISSRGSLLAFQQVRQRVSEWPGIPMAIVEPSAERTAELWSAPLRKVLPVRATLAEAMRACREPPFRHRQVRLPCQDISVLRARLFVTDTCVAWDVHEELGTTMLVTDELVRTALRAGGPELRLRVVLSPGRLRLAVRDRVAGSTATPDTALLDRLTRLHGSVPAAGGTVHWAVLPVS